MSKIFFIEIVIFGFLILNSCAIMKSPEGGPKDIIPPRVIKESPPNYSLNFNKNRIQLTFNEYIQVKNIQKDIIITPFMSQKPDFIIKKNKIIINLKDTLKKNTTYNFNFGECISDLSEGNILRNYHYVFSSGNYLDTCEIKGIVLDALKQEPNYNIKILLYTWDCDSCLFKAKPLYYATTDSMGHFDIRYIRQGKYLLFALQDENNNYKYDPNEKIGFMNKAVEINKEKKEFVLNIFKENEKKPGFIGYKIIDDKKIKLFFKGRTENFSISQKINQDFQKLYFNSDKNCDSFNAWYYQSGTDTNIINIRYDNKDTVIKFYTSKPKKKNIEKIQKIKLNVSDDLNKSLKFYIYFSEPIKIIRNKEITIIKDSIKYKEKLNVSFTDSSKTVAYLNDNLLGGINYKYILPDSLFESIYRTDNDTFIFNINPKKEEELGLISVKMTVTVEFKTAIIQLINKNYEVIRQENINKSGTISFNNLIPDSYKIRVIIDKNENGRWDPGNVIEEVQPEKVFYYPDLIILKANWEINDLIFIIPAL